MQMADDANAQPELVWSGLKRGPPRKLKFPDDEEVVQMAHAFVAKHKAAMNSTPAAAAAK